MPRLFRGEIIGSLELVKPVKFSGDCEVWLVADSNGDFAILKSAPAPVPAAPLVSRTRRIVAAAYRTLPIIFHRKLSLA